MNILFVASEVDPFAKTGGLADVASALPKALAQLGHDVRIIMPRYRAIDMKQFGLKKVRGPDPIVVGPNTIDATVFEAQVPGTKIIPPPDLGPKGPRSSNGPPSVGKAGGGITTYFVDQPALFDRDGLYQDTGRDFPDNLERFSFFSQAVLSVIQKLGWQPEIVHCHDWQTALVCAHLAVTRREDRFWQSAGTVLTVHNLAYQGLFPKDAWALTNLPEQAFRIEGLEFYDQINCLKGGLVYADCLSTVSPTYSREIQTPEFGCGLEGVLVWRRDDLQGILNGIDVDVWNPKTDRHLAASYWDGELAGKSVCKLWLQKRHALPQHHVFLIGMIQRLAEQKGIDIFVQAAEEILALPLQLVILGTGDPVYHEQLERLAKRFPDKLAVTLGFDNALAHQIEAGGDAFLMPSRFEPCGLNQMYSMRYGTIPIVRQVGGLADTVRDVSPATLEAGTATGFVFTDYSAKALLAAVKRAVAAFRNPEL